MHMPFTSFIVDLSAEFNVIGIEYHQKLSGIFKLICLSLF